MAGHERLICTADALEEGGRGMRFEVESASGKVSAFAVRYDGRVHAYVNRCAHVPVELDWSEGEFFDTSQLYLICATHGAMYAPETGACLAGPCKGGRLHKLAVSERDGAVYLLSEESIHG